MLPLRFFKSAHARRESETNKTSESFLVVFILTFHKTLDSKNQVPSDNRSVRVFHQQPTREKG